MKKLIMIVLGWLSIAANAQPPAYPAAPPAVNLVKAEYFFDIDPGQGNGTPVTLPPAQDINNFTASLALNGSGLTNGFHRFYIRTQDGNGRWSHAASAFFNNFLVPAYPAAPAAAANLAEAEYFIDTDPGLGQATKLALPASTDVSSFNILVNVGNLAPGLHRLYVRTRDAAGKWTFTNFSLFDNSVQTPYPTAPAPAPPLSQAEYYFDTDPGFGNGTAITLPSSTDVANFSFNASLPILPEGRHTIYLRSRQNPWSLTAYAEFAFGAVLPVSFLYAKAEAVGDDARISWATGFEQNADRFEIEYSANGAGFNKVGQVQATNNAAGGTYQYRHAKPASRTAYYRIKQVDKDGKAVYSKMLLVVFNSNKSEPFAFPNPARDMINVLLQPAIFNRVDVVSADGKAIKTVRVEEGQQAVSIGVKELKPGNYLLLLYSAGKPVTLRFIKQ